MLCSHKQRSSKNLDRALTASINEELLLTILDELFAAGLDVREVAVQQTPHKTNFFHIVTLKHQARLSSRMLDHFFDLLPGDAEGLQTTTPSANATHSKIQEGLARALWRSLAQQEHYLKRTPLHSAAAVYGDEEMYVHYGQTKMPCLGCRFCEKWVFVEPFQPPLTD